MGTFFVYILKSSACLVFFYLFFRLLMSKETFHRFNRLALLGVLFLSLIIPWIQITTTRQVEVNQALLTIEQLLMMADAANMPVAASDMSVATADIVYKTPSVTWIQILLFIYLAGILFFVFRNIYSLVCLIRLIRSGKREKIEKGVVLVVHEQEIAPFSWLKYIVISRKDLEENGREILIHEMAHIQNRHSFDLLLADICIFFQWFNPGAWLLKQELQNIHEYEADDTVIEKGINAKEYQLLLIKKAVGTRLYSMANSFNHSKLKKRITMMLKEKSSPWARLKYLYVLPLAAIAVTAFARPEISEKVEEISAVKVNDLAEILQEKVLQDTVKVSQTMKNSVEVVGAKTEKEEEFVIFEVVEQMPQYPGGMDALRKYLVDKTSASTLKDKVGGRALVGFTVNENGKIKDVQVMESDQPALNKEAERIVSEMPDWIPGKQRGVPVSVKYSVPVNFGNVRFAENKTPMILADGKEISKEALDKLNPATIQSVSVLKDSASISLYGKRGENGVVLVTTKKKNKTYDLAISFPSEAAPTNAVTDYPVSGTVVDEQGRPKPGVSIVVPNTNAGAITDSNGHFKLKAVKNGTLWFSYIGYKSVKAPVASTMTVKMEQEVVNLLPGLSSSAVVGNASTGVAMNSVSLHGLKEGEQPLVIIDGKEALDKNVLSTLSPSRIKSISVLTEDSGKSIYGDKAKHGVIVVEMLTEKEFQARQDNK